MDQWGNTQEGCREKVYSESVLDFFIPYNGDLQSVFEKYSPDCIQPINQRYVVGHFTLPLFGETISGSTVSYAAIPKCYAVSQEQTGAMDAARSSKEVLEAMGIGRLRRLPYLDLFGNGVLIGFLDTGIDYQNKVFTNPDRTSRIFSIWDQTNQEGNPPEGFIYGAEYTKEDLDRALAAEDPYSLVPERDENGHGTFVAGIAAGSNDPENDFSGVAPQASIVMVKLKRAKQYLKDFYVIPKGAECYQETDLVLGLKYLVETARRTKRPLVICMTLNTNSGGHDGTGIMDEILSAYASEYGFCAITSTGDEVGYSLHYHGMGQSQIQAYEEIELRVGEQEGGFTMELWASSLNLYSISVVSPTGEIISRIPGKGNRSQKMNFLFEDTRIYLDYYMVEVKSGEQLVLIRVYQPVAGIWKFQIYTEQDFGGNFDIWLPLHVFVDQGTYFLRADPNITITCPGNAQTPITVASYRIADKSIYLHSGRGFTRDNRIKPDIAAPGAEIYGPLPGGSYGFRDGGSVACALTAGACALLLEWGVVMGRRPEIETAEIKRLLKGGAEREGLTLPSREWGFGRLDLYGAFEELRIVVNT